MMAVLFEVTLAPGRQADYLDLAAQLRPLLAQSEGFISIERVQSLSQPDKLLSLSYWCDEQALAAWRQLEAHRAAQARGREALFADYRLRIASVVRDYGLHQRDQAPADSRSRHA